MGDQVALHVLWVDEVGQAEFAGERLTRWVEVHADDHVGTDHAGALDHVQPDAAQAEDHDIGSGLHLRGE
jgi:hypothetical protein